MEQEERYITRKWARKFAANGDYKAAVEQPGGRQDDGAVCPRCGATMPGPAVRHALSRRAMVMVCDRCGMAEALEDAGLLPRLELSDWEFIKTLQN